MEKGVSDNLTFRIQISPRKWSTLAYRSVIMLERFVHKYGTIWNQSVCQIRANLENFRPLSTRLFNYVYQPEALTLIPLRTFSIL